MKEKVSRLAKSAVVQYVTVFGIILAKRVRHWFSGLRQKGITDIESFDVGGDEFLASKSSF